MFQICGMTGIWANGSDGGARQCDPWQEDAVKNEP